MTVHNFEDKLSWSQGLTGETCENTILTVLPGCVSVVESTKEQDKNGVDYWATLRGGAKLAIDLKAREKGASKFWRHGEPELALEVWSVVPGNGFSGKVGWTLDESKITDYILYLFDPSDTKQCYLIPFQLLRMAFRENYYEWEALYGEKKQYSNGWKSSAVFVPAQHVLNSVSNQMKIYLDAA